MQVIWNRLYKTDSLHQLKNLLHRSVPAAKVKLNYCAVHDFFNIVLDAHMTAAAMEYLGMTCTNDKPTRNGFVRSIDVASDKEKKKYLFSFVTKLIQRIFRYTTTNSSWSVATTDL